ncbi:MAG: Replicative DNA helicase [Candidatus Hydrogenedentes bacterium ADurb.Bin101]|nr:MAG: Replicative DNA helicase [Candidatus Hydrogenedentes bacterium ADurb.Bin101]
MAENGNGKRHRIALPGHFTQADLRNLRAAVESYCDIPHEDKQRLQPLLQTLARPFEAPQAAEITSPDQPRVYRLGDLLEEWDTFAEEAYEARQGNKPLGIKTGLDKVDEEIGGVFQPGLHSIQGGPGVGKTAFALQVACSCGFPALYVTCEMAPLELLRRIAARVTGTYLGKFKSGELEPDQAKAQVRRAIATCPNLAILDSTRGYVPAFAPDSNPNAMNLFDLAETLRGDSPHVVIVIDSLHSWADKALADLKEYEYLNTAIGSLRGLAAVLDCPVIAIAERNRQSMDKGGISGGAGTRKIEYSAESVIELDSTNGGPDANGEASVSLKLSKNRNGVIGRSVELRFNGALQRYREV